MLSEPKVIETLNRDYVSSWVLFQDLIKTLGINVDKKPGREYIDAVKSAAAMLTDTGTEYQRLCAKLLARYTYPVDTHVFDRQGMFVGNTYAGDIMSDPLIWQRFADLLKRGAKR